MLVILEIYISLISIKQFLLNQCHSPYNRGVRSYRVLYLQFFGLYDICIIFLHAVEACLKAIIAMFYLVLGQLPRGKLPPGQFPRRIIVSEENCPLTIKFPPKIHFHSVDISEWLPERTHISQRRLVFPVKIVRN